MQKAYHDLKEQALRMSIEQDAQKSQIEEEIKKLKVSNQDLIKKNKVTFQVSTLSEIYGEEITQLLPFISFIV
jgi:predicted transcriptional regulator